MLPQTHPLRDGRTAHSPLMAAYSGCSSDRHPVWFMRQAGRSLPEYRAARAGTTMMQACLDPELVTELTLQPVRRHGVDAAIFFSDIVTPVKLAGIDIEIAPGVGPRLADPLDSPAAIDHLRFDQSSGQPATPAGQGDPAHRPATEPAGAFDPQRFVAITRAVQLTVAELGATPLIGFAGAPFTLASYLIEGGPSRDQLRTKTLMHTEPAAWHAIASWTAALSAAFLRAQVLAGASAVQLFDSWAGSVNPVDYRERVAPYTAAVFAAVADLGVPMVHFALGSTGLITEQQRSGATVIGIDHRVYLADAINRIGPDARVQGNLDPALLFAPTEVLHRRAADILAAGWQARGHVFNLGHGVPPTTDPDVLTRLVDFIHDQS